MFGFTFAPVGGGSTVKLGSVKALGMVGGNDSIQVINPSTLATDVAYTYYSDAQAQAEAMEEAEGDEEAFEEVYAELKELVGWWINGKLGKESADDVEITVGSGFLGLSPKSNDITFTCAGEAPTSPKSYSAGAVRSPIFANFLPSDCYLKDILVSGMVGGNDSIQVINPTTLATDAAYTYYSDEQAQAEAMEEAEGDEEAFEEVYAELKELVGWWVNGKLGKESADDVVVKAGQAFLGLSKDANAMTFKFKSVLDLTPIAK